MISGFVKAVYQLSDPSIRWIVWKSLLITAAVMVVLWFLLGLGLRQIDIFDSAWLEAVVDFLGGTAAVMLTILALPAVIGIVSSLFLEEVAAAVEARHYPRRRPAREQGLFEAVALALRFAGVTVLLNLAALPLYLLFAWLPPINLFIFYGLNGYLVGREYFELAAFRRLEPGVAERLRQRHRLRLALAGALIVAMLTIPLVNLLTPIVATAFMVHVFEGLRGKGTI